MTIPDRPAEEGAPASGQSCLNCGTPLTGPYCAACGQRARSPNPSVGECVEEIGEELLRWNGRVPSSLAALMREPGRLTEDFLAGRRARWLSPLRLYLLCSIAYFLSGPLIERVTGHGARALAELEATGDRAEVRMLLDSATFVNDPELRRNRVVQAIGAGRAWMLVTRPALLTDIVAEAAPRAMFLLLPLFALLTRLAWRRARMRYPAHLAFALHLHAAFFAMLLVPRVLEPIGSAALDVVAQLAVVAWATWYASVACRRALGGTPGQVLWRATVVGLVYLPAALATTLLAAVVAIRAL